MLHLTDSHVKSIILNKFRSTNESYVSTMYPQVNLIKFDCDQANYWLRAQNTGWKYSKLVLRNTWYLAKEVTQKRAQSFPFLVTVKWTGSW